MPSTTNNVATLDNPDWRRTLLRCIYGLIPFHFQATMRVAIAYGRLTHSNFRFSFGGNMSRRIQLLFIVILLGLAAVAPLDAGQTRGARGAQPAAPQPPAPLSISQVIESLYSLGVTRTEELVS